MRGRFIRCLFYASTLVLAAALLASWLLYSEGMLGIAPATVYSSMALSLLFSVAVVSYLLAKGNTLHGIADSLGLSRRRLTSHYLVMGLGLFALFMVIEFGIAAFSFMTGIQLQTNVETALGGLPAYFYVFTVLVAPVNEEILFRGFMVPRLGIVVSSVIFAALHYVSYFSYVEFAAALAFGLIASYVFKKTGSLYPSITGHALVNLIGIVSAFG